MNQVWAKTISAYSIVAAECRDASSAAVLFYLLAPWSDQWATTGTSMSDPISLNLGLLATVAGRYDDADQFYAKASAMTDRIGQTFFAATTDRWWGQMLAQRDAPGDLDRARDLLLRARTVAAANGYAYIERRATEALQRLG